MLRIAIWFRVMLISMLMLNWNSYGQTFPSGKQAYSVQMHLHAHSHHNGATMPASMQWHAHYAHQFSQDVLWWTDHDEVLNLSRILNYNLSASTYVDFQGNVVNMSGSIERPTRLEANISGGQYAAAVQNKVLSWQLTANTANWDSFGYVPRGTFGKLKQFRLPRPISSQAVLKLVLEPIAFSPNIKHQVIVELSWHFQQSPVMHKVVYTLVPDSVHIPSVNQGDSTVYVYVPCQITQDTLLLNILSDALLLPDGDDNTITDINIQILAKNGKTARLRLHYFELYSNAPQPQNQLDQMQLFGSRYAARYQHQEIIGIEFATGSNNREFHLNGFVQKSQIRDSVLYGDSLMRIYPDSFAHSIRRSGGVVSFNHPFGTSSAVLDPDPVQDSRCLYTATSLLQNQAYGCDIIEIGSYVRGGIDLNRHTKLWDILTANKLYLYGNGTFDSHGGAWYDMMSPNSMTTWVWADDSSSESLLDGLKRGRMYFGNPFRYDGRFDFWVGSTARMGDRTTATQAFDTLAMSFDTFPPGSKVYLYQGLINNPGMSVNYLLFKEQINPYSTHCLDLQNPCFVRVEVYDAKNRCILLSNPIVFHTAAQTSGNCFTTNLPESPQIIINSEQGILFIKPGDFQKLLTIRLLNSTGQTVWQKHFLNTIEYQAMLPEGVYTFSYKNSDYQAKISNGVYFIQLLKDDEYSYSQKIMLLND